MSDVKSKNLYELLGNTSDQDSDREPEPPTKAIDKTAGRIGKRDAPKAAPAAPVASAPAGGNARGGANRRAGGFTGNEAAFRDRTTGRNFNREKQTEEGTEAGVRPGRETGPGTRSRGRGARGPRRGGDRHSRTGQSEHQKQTDQAWGGQTGEGEWADEKAGETIAKEEIKEDGFGAAVEAPVDGEGNTAGAEEQEPEDTSKSYADYLAEQAAKKLEGLGLKEARQANEGSKENKKWASAKPLSKEADEEYFAGQEKARRERERTSKKEFLDVDYSFKEQPRESRGGARGGRGRGRGDRGDFAGRGRGGRGEFRGDTRGRGRGGASTRGRGGSDGTTVALNDESAFPSLGA